MMQTLTSLPAVGGYPELAGREDAILSYKAGGERHSLKSWAKALVSRGDGGFRLMDDAAYRGFRASLATLTGSAGGYTVSPGTMNEGFEIALLSHSVMRRLSTIIRTDRAGDYHYPMLDDTANEGRLLPENTMRTASDITLGKTVFNAYKFDSDIVKMSFELFQDAIPSFMATLGTILGQRVARLANRLYTVGTGAGQPMGVATSCPVGVTAASATAITSDEVWSLVYSVDDVYRQNASFSMSDALLKAIRTLKDTSNQYIFAAPTQPGMPGMLCGYPVAVNAHMVSTVATGNRTILFGDFSRYVIREVDQIQLQSFRELSGYIENDLIGLAAVLRADGALVNAGQGPVKCLKQA